VLEVRRLLSADVLTYHNDNARSGVDSSETILTPADVNASSFGKVGFDAVDGKVDAQPLYVAGVSIPGQGTHNVLYVATENDSVYAFDADTGTVLWHVSMLGPGEVPSDPVYGMNVAPEIGITSTPVIDLDTDTMYVVAMSRLVSGNTTTYFQRIHALDITTGADKVPPTSIDQSITYPGAGPGGNGTDVIFDPEQYLERDALLLVNGVVYTSWTSHHDNPPYTGWMIGFNASNLSLAAVLNINPNGAPASSFHEDGSGSSFWNSGGGPAADAAGNLYNTSANGPFDPTLNAAGSPPTATTATAT
jgi:outer membrane protein assembly factor BamB